MGIPSLNYFIRTACPHGITNISLKQFWGKKIAIDTSIYLYKFKGAGGIIDNMYIMCTLFKRYNIVPIFVFDGKPPPEKMSTLHRRKLKKETAENDYNRLKSHLETDISFREKNKIRGRMKILKKKFIRVKNKEISQVKEFFDVYAIAYVDAPCEADLLCAKMTIEGVVDACLSEDMDLFVYGCPIVLRYLDLVNQSVVKYDLTLILHNLNLTLENFIYICVLTGTDYSMNKKKKSFHYNYQLFKRFENTRKPNFYEWLDQNQLLPDSIAHMVKITKMFNINNIPIPCFSIPCTINRPQLKDILEKCNFIFPPDTF